MSIQQNFPAISPSLNLNFARSKTLDPRITFSRTSTATRVNEQGLVEVMSADIPRFDHEYDASTGVIKSLGLLVEEQRTNLIQRSEEFDDPSWSTSSLTITPNDTTAPNGTLTADRWQNTSTTGIISQAITKAASATTYTASIWVKSSDSTNFSFTIDDGATINRGRCTFNITTGELATESDNGDFTNTSGSIIAYPDSWYRISVTTTTNTQTTARFRAFFSGSGDTAYIWGAQLEAGAFPTSYIPTSGSTATRNPDSVSMEGDNFSDWYNQSEGTVFVDSLVKYNPNATKFVWSLYGGSIDHSLRQPHLTGLRFRAVIGGAFTPAPGTGGFAINGSTTKAAVAYDSTTGRLQVGTSGDDVTMIGTADPTIFKIGSHNGTISQLTYYPRRLTNTQLQSLTK